MSSTKKLQAIGIIVAGISLGIGYYYSGQASQTTEIEKTKRQENRIKVLREGIEYIEKRRQEKADRKDTTDSVMKEKVTQAKAWLEKRKGSRDSRDSDNTD